MLPRQEGLKRAAQARALITACINNTHQPLSKRQVWAALNTSLTDLGYKPTNLDNFLSAMASNKLILSGLSTEVGANGQKVRVYGPANGSVEITNINTPIRRRVDKSISESLVVDIVKATGRIRLNLKGLVIEIGVVE